MVVASIEMLQKEQAEIDKDLEKKLIINEPNIMARPKSTFRETMNITNLGYDWSAAIRRKVLRDFPRVDIEELGEEIKMLLLKRIQGEDIENTDLVRLMPWVAPQKEAAVDVRQEITHRFVVVKPGDEEPAEEKAEDN